MLTIIKPVRCNTYENYFRVIVLSPKQQIAEDKAKWLAGNENELTSPVSTYKTTFQENVKLIVFARSDKYEKYKIETVAIDGLCLFLESQLEWQQVKEGALKHFLTIPVKLIISDCIQAKDWAKDIGAVVLPKTCLVETIKNTLDALDREEYQRLKNVFEKFDRNSSGHIEKNEIPNIARQIGMDIKSPELQKALITLNSNRNQKLDIDEFILWYKISQINPEALAHVSELSKWISHLCKKVVNYEQFNYETANLEEEFNEPNKINIKLDTGCSKPGSRVGIKFIAGNQKERKLATRNFLSKFTDLGEAVDENWIDITIFVNSLTFKGYEIETYLESFRQKLIQYAEKHFLNGLSNLIKRFIVFRFFPQLNSGTIVFRLKEDVFEIVRNALHEVLQFKDWITDNGRSVFDVSINITSEECIGKLSRTGKSIVDLLRNAEVNIEGSCLKHKVKALLNSLNKEYQQYIPLLQLLFAPNAFKIKQKGPVEDLLVNESFKNLFENNLNFLKPFGDFIKANFDQEILDCMRRFEIAINCYDMFANIQVFSDTLWK
jgi:hypothetical protein